MATITGLTAERMQEIIDQQIVEANVIGGYLILVTEGGSPIVAGLVVGPAGPAGGGNIICTSTTRPTLFTGDAGKTIYETDTGLVLLWSGTAWKDLPGSVPLGGTVPYYGLSEPSGNIWKFPNGQAISRATYPALFSLVGTAYGVGDGSTTFNLPDSRDRMLMQSSNPAVIGSTGGATTFTLTTPNLPVHAHDDGTLAALSAGSHDHTSPDGNVFVVSIGGVQAARLALPSEATGPYVTYTSVDDGGAHTHTVGGITGDTGSATPVNKMPPYMTCNRLIRVR